MKKSEFTPFSPGELVAVSAAEPARGIAFLPGLLPPTLSLEPSIWKLAEEASFALGNLNGLGSRLPSPTLLARPFVRKEALASSRIEGTRAEYEQLVLFEAETGFKDIDGDVREVANHVRATSMAWASDIGFPILSRSGIASVHKELLQGVRGEYANPGNFRSGYVMIGQPGDTLATARFVPCPPQEIAGRLDNLLQYMRQPEDSLPLLVQLAISHYQFEVIHPFNDGNGRVGRMLIPLILKQWGRLDTPILYLSEYLERHRDEYIDSLHRISTHGSWQAWISFFLRAVRIQAEDAWQRGSALLDLREDLRSRYQEPRKARALALIDSLFERPSLTYRQAQDLTELSTPAANALVRSLVDDGILIEATGRKRNQIFYAPTIARASMGVLASGEEGGSF